MSVYDFFCYQTYIEGLYVTHEYNLYSTNQYSLGVQEVVRLVH
jgi:hypothetical protein